MIKIKILKFCKNPAGVEQVRLLDNYINSFSGRDYEEMLICLLTSVVPRLRALKTDSELKYFTNFQSDEHGRIFLKDKYYNPISHKFEIHKIIKIIMGFDGIYEFRIDSVDEHRRILFEIQELDIIIISFAFTKYEMMEKYEIEKMDGTHLTNHLAGYTHSIQKQIERGNAREYRNWTGGKNNEI